MPIDIINTSHISYPIKAADLQYGTLYEGSDNQLYVGAHIRGCKTSEGLAIYAIGFGNGSYIDNDILGAKITFRELKGTLHYE